jgi:3-methyladenine DNA glycosylase AlkD
MIELPTAKQFVEKLEALKSESELKKYEVFFPSKKRDGDVFIGVKMGDIFNLAKENMDMPLDQVEVLLKNPIHEVRVGAVSIMDYQARDNTTTEEHKKELFDLYIKCHDCINTWDLVDRSSIYVVGRYLFNKPRDVLYKLAKSDKMAERRTAIISTLYFIKNGDTSDTFKIAKMLLEDEDALINKAVGWALRAAGGEELLEFLNENAGKMPRITLRYAIEKLPKELKTRYLRLK